MKKRENFFLRLLHGSLILGLLSRFADFLGDSVKKSLIGSAFSAYDREERARISGLFHQLFQKLSLTERVRKMKLHINRQMENSLLLNLARALGRGLLDLPVRMYGVFFLTYGAYSAAIYGIAYVAVNFKTPDIYDLVTGITIMAAAFPAVFVKKRLGDCLLESRLMDLILFRILGIRRIRLEGENAPRSQNTAAFLAGTVTGALTYFVTPLYVPLIIAALLGGILLLSIPESGVLLIFFALPFLPTMPLAGLVIVVSLCWLLKLIRGKRTLKLELADLAVLLFFVTMLFGGLISAGGTDSLRSALMYGCFIFGYFLVIGLIRSEEWVRRCVAAAVGGCFFVSLYGIYENFFGLAKTTWQDEKLFENISGRVVSTFENPNVLAEYLILCLPFMLAVLMARKEIPYKLAALVLGGSAGLCLIFTWSRGAWLGILFGVLVYFLIVSRKTMVFMAFGLCAVPFLPFVLPASITSRFLSIGNLKDTSTNYRVNIWKAAVRMARDYFWSGIGVGTSAFANVYPEYSLAGIEGAPHSHNLYLQILVEVGIFGLVAFLTVIFLFAQNNFSFYDRVHDALRPEDGREMKLYSAAGFCAVIGILVQGMTDHVWYNYRVSGMFWLVLGLTVAIRRAALRNIVDCAEEYDADDSAVE